MKIHIENTKIQVEDLKTKNIKTLVENTKHTQVENIKHWLKVDEVVWL